MSKLRAMRLKEATAALGCGSLATVRAANNGAVLLHVRFETAEEMGHRMFLSPEEAKELGRYLIAAAECAAYERDEARWRGPGGDGA